MATLTESKLRGGYYTPTAVAQFLVEWAITPSTRRVLEPSAGDGVLVKAAAAILSAGSIDAIEFLDAEAEKIRELNLDAVEVITADALGWYSGESDATYDAVIGNPPFIRYQSFLEEHRIAGFELMRAEGLNPNRLTNAWVPFVVLATRALKPGGRLALVLPAELMQVGYAAELREYLAKSFTELNVVTFERLVFDNIQQETVLLTGIRAGKKSAPAVISFTELSDAASLNPSLLRSPERKRMHLDHTREKWVQYYLSNWELGLLRELEKSPQFVPLGELARVNVGIVTGRNEFFVLRPSEAAKLGLAEYCLPLIGRSAQIPGLQLTEVEWGDLHSEDGKCLLLQLGRTPRTDLSEDALRYIQSGEARGFQDGYKLRIRLPEWWHVPSYSVPDAFMLRQIYDAPRIVLNRAHATSTDTVHRVWAKEGVDPHWLAAASLNSVTLAFSEVRGRSYGGGVLELEPSEAEGLPFPLPNSELNLEHLDGEIRHAGTEAVLSEVDRLVLAATGLSGHEIEGVRRVWLTLSNRRKNRKGSNASSDSMVA